MNPFKRIFKSLFSLAKIILEFVNRSRYAAEQHIYFGSKKYKKALNPNDIFSAIWSKLEIFGKTKYYLTSTPAAPLFNMRNSGGLFLFRASDEVS